MKVIDLLNKIANGEEVPKKIKINDIEFEIYTESPNIDYKLANGQSTYLFQDYIYCYGEIKLNDEVEIIEEDKEIEKIEVYQQITANGNEHNYINYNGSKYAISTPQRLIIENQNKLIDEVNKLKNKLF